MEISRQLPLKVAITGGPSGGKTTLIETLQKEMSQQIAVVPEAASILYRGGFPRRKTPNRMKHAQKAIYFLQVELEEMVAEENKTKLIICDRGSMDALAYWPEDGTNFLNSVQSSEMAELARYDFVLHLDTAPQSDYDTDNPIRTESYEEAFSLNLKTKKAWDNHPARIVIQDKKDFLSKMIICLDVINGILDKKDFKELQKIIKQR